MGRFEVQGIVSAKDKQPYVQLRQLDEKGFEEAGFQVSPMEAREIAQNILEAATNAIYEAAIMSWAIERDPKDGEVIGIQVIDAIRRHRADRWGLPDRPQDWRPGEH
jgi:hypothetical protein